MPTSPRHDIILLAQAAVGLAGMEARFIACPIWARPIALSRVIKLEMAEVRGRRVSIPMSVAKPAPAAHTAARVALSLALARLSCVHALLAETSAAAEAQPTAAGQMFGRSSFPTCDMAGRAALAGPAGFTVMLA